MWGSEDVIVLCLASVEVEPALPYIGFLIGMETVNEGAAGAVAIYYHFEYIC